jgi:serine/threonine-protein kinase
MRYVEGSDLKHVLKSEGALEPTRALGLVEELADALDAAHARGLVHRDVKPSNALLDNSGHLYLSDFGLTKSASDRSALTLTGRIIGTVDYAAPEQIEGKGVDGRADVYSLGCLLYECLSGQVPFPRDSELAVLWAHVHEPPPKLAAYPAIDPVIAKVLAKHPKARYASCAEFVEAARKALGPREVVILRDRKPLLMAALGMLLAAGALTAGLVLALGGGGSRPKADLTVRENTLVRIDPKANRIVAVTPVGRRPRAVAVGGSLVWVYNADDNTVTSIDAGTNAVEETDAVPGFPPSDPFSHPLAADNTGAWLVTSVGGEGFLTHIRPGRPFQPQYRLPYEPVSVAIGQGSIWVAARTANSLWRPLPHRRAHESRHRPRQVSVRPRLRRGHRWRRNGLGVNQPAPHPSRSENTARGGRRSSSECVIWCRRRSR